MNRSGNQSTRGIYRARNGMVFGVCKGIAEYMGFSAGWLRVGTVLAAFFLGGWPVVGGYIVLALIMKPEPVLRCKSAQEEEFYRSYASSRSMAIQRLKSTSDNIERRIRRIEGIVTARDYDWDRRLNEDY